MNCHFVNGCTLGIFTNLIKSNDDNNMIQRMFIFILITLTVNIDQSLTQNIADNFDFFIQRTQFKQFRNEDQVN